ncbi:MAG: VirC2 family conjugal transfer protein [Pseudomonadota bacterium]
MGIRKPKVSAREARQLAGQIPGKKAKEQAIVKKNESSGPQAPKVPSPIEATEPVLAREPSVKANIKPKPDITPGPVPTSRMAPIRSAKTQVFLSAIIPAPGVSKSFDELSRYYPATKALQMILRRAMSDYEILLANGKFAKSTMAYPVPDGRPDQLLVQTSRSMPNELIEVATNHFDPLGFESKRAFGLKLATAALATFFKNER